jgi:hypothetical protein
MENKGILAGRKSMLLKTQLICFAAALIGTALFLIFAAVDDSQPSGFTSPLGIVQIGLSMPSFIILKSLGSANLLSPDHGRGNLVPCLIITGINGMLGFLFGSLLGWLLTRNAKGQISK